MDKIIMLVVSGGVVVLVFYVISVFNKLVSLNNRVKNSLAQVEVQLKRRYDLIPNIVEIAKGYIKHERETLESVTYARNTAVSALQSLHQQSSSTNLMQQLAGAETGLQHALSGFRMTMESYPELMASKNMIHLSNELIATENLVLYARASYNDSVMLFNTYKQSFPQLIFSSVLGYAEDAAVLLFPENQDIQAVPRVDF